MQTMTRDWRWRAWALAAALLAPEIAVAAPVELANAIYAVESPGEVALCAAGDVAVGGGGRAQACTSGSEPICGARMYPAYDGPLADWTGWRYSQNLVDGTVVTESTTVTCLAVSAHPELADIMYLATASGFGVSAVSCEPGDLLVGGGADPTPWLPCCPGATLDFDFPSGFAEDTAGTREYALGWAYGFDHEIDAAYDNDVVYAVCLRASSAWWWSSIYLVRSAGTLAACHAGDRVIAGGGLGPQCNDGSQPACYHPVQYGHDGPVIDASGSEAWEYAAMIQDWGWGTTETVAMCVRGDPDGDGFLEVEGDCAPDDPSIAPDVAEVCEDGIDNDCDRLADLDDFDCVGPEPSADADADADMDADGGTDADTDTHGTDDGGAVDTDASGGDDGGITSDGPGDDAGCSCTAARARAPGFTSRVPLRWLVDTIW